MYKILLSPYTRIFYNEWKLNPDRSDYNIVFNQELSGELDVSRLANSIRSFISEHVVFNSCVKERDGELFWEKNKKVYELEYTDGELSNRDILSFIITPFDLESGPLYRFRLIRTDHNKYNLIIVLHHIIIDGLSVDYFVKTLSAYYNDQTYNNNISIEDQILTISKTSKDLSEYVQQGMDESKEFWKKILSDVEPLDLSFLSLKNDESESLKDDISQKPDTPINKLSRIGEIRFSFDRGVLEKLNKLRGSFLITPYLFGQSIFVSLLHRYTGQDKFCVSYPITIKEGMDFIYGAHVNTNVIPYDFTKFSNNLDIVNYSRDFILREFIKSKKHHEANHSYLPIYDIISVSNKDILKVGFVQTNLKDNLFDFNNVAAKILYDANIDLANELFFEQETSEEVINYRVRYNLNKQVLSY